MTVIEQTDLSVPRGVSSKKKGEGCSMIRLCTACEQLHTAQIEMGSSKAPHTK